MFAYASELGADYMVVPHHSGYRQHCKMQLQYGVEVQFYLGIVAQAVGLPFEKKLKELRHLDNVDRAVEQLRPRIAKFGYNLENVRS